MSKNSPSMKKLSHYFIIHFGYKTPVPELEASFATKESAYQWLKNKQEELNAGRHSKDTNGTFVIKSYEKPNFDWSLPKDGIYSLSNGYTTMEVYIVYEKDLDFSLFNRTIENNQPDIIDKTTKQIYVAQKTEIHDDWEINTLIGIYQDKEQAYSQTLEKLKKAWPKSEWKISTKDSEDDVVEYLFTHLFNNDDGVYDDLELDKELPWQVHFTITRWNLE